MSAPERSYVAHVFAEAVARLSNAKTIEQDADQAASVVAFVGKKLELDERALSDLIRIADRWIGHASIVRSVVKVLRAQAAPEEALKLLPGIVRLARRASAAGSAASVFVLVGAMAREPTWSSHVESTWVAQALDHVAIDRAKHPATHQLLDSLVRSALAPKLREVLNEHPDILKSLGIPPWLAWRVQVVAPTIDGWRTLASRSSRDNDVPDASTFASQLDIAIDTLEAAVGSEPEGARRVTLARWLAELRGTP